MRQDKGLGSLLFVNQHYPPDIAATGQNLSDLAEHLSQSGYDVGVWCGQGRYVEGRLRAPASEVLNGVKVQRLRTTAFSRSTRTGRLTNYFLFYIQVLARLLLGGRRDNVIFLTTPPLLSLVGYLSSAFRGQRYAVWIMDLHPEAEIAAGMISARGVVAQLLHRCADSGRRNADFVVGLGRCMRDRIVDRGVDTARLHTVSGWTDADCIVPIDPEDNTLRGDLEIAHETVVSYSGNAGIAHRFSEVCEAMARLANDANFHFVFIGDGPRRSYIEQYARSHSISNYTQLAYFPRSALHYSLSLPDIHLVTLRTEFAGIAVPAKLYGIMAAARPALFIGPTNCETADVIMGSKCGAVIDPDREPDSVGRIVATLREWSADPDLRAEMGRRGRAAVRKCHDRDLCCAEFERIIRQHWGGPTERTTAAN